MSEEHHAIIAEYTALRTEICQRVSRKEKTVISWLLVLTGGLIGVFLKVNIPGTDTTLISALINNQISSIALMFSVVIIIGYILAVELLISYSHYQLYMAFQLSNYIITLDRRIKDVLSFNKDYPLFGWDKESRGGAEINLTEIDDKAKCKVTICLDIASRLDLLTPSVMAICGLVALTCVGLIAIYKSIYIISLICFISLIFFTVILYILYFVYKYLHLWVQRTSSEASLD